MRSSEWLFEAEQNITVKKYLNLLSNLDIDNILLNLTDSVNEVKEEPTIGELPVIKNPVIDKKPKASSVKKTPAKKVTKPNNELNSVISKLSKKEKELLIKTLQQEKIKRKKSTNPKKLSNTPNINQVPVEKKSPGMLSKIVVGLAIAIGALAAIPDNPKDSERQPVAQEQFKNDREKIDSISDTIYDMVFIKDYKPSVVNSTVSMMANSDTMQNLLDRMVSEAYAGKRSGMIKSRQTYRDFVWVVILGQGNNVDFKG